MFETHWQLQAKAECSVECGLRNPNSCQGKQEGRVDDTRRSVWNDIG